MGSGIDWSGFACTKGALWLYVLADGHQEWRWKPWATPLLLRSATHGGADTTAPGVGESQR